MSKPIKICSLFLLLLLSMALSACQDPYPVDLPKTGQTECYFTSYDIGPEACDGGLEMGVDWPSPRFTITYCTEFGPCEDQAQDCDDNPSTDYVLDHLTGLMWARDADIAGSYQDFDEALEYLHFIINGYGDNPEGSLCGYQDWHLPNINEFRSIVHFGFNEEICGSAPCESLADWLGTQGFVDITIEEYWTNTIHFASIMNGQPKNFNTLKGDTESGPGPCKRMWPVRGGYVEGEDFDYTVPLIQTGQLLCYGYPGGEQINCEGTYLDGELRTGISFRYPRWEHLDDGTIRDLVTGLIWQRDANCFFTHYWGAVGSPFGYMNWTRAARLVTRLNDGDYELCSYGHTDWRIPNIHELASLIDYGNTDLSIVSLPEGIPFFNLDQNKSFYWTSTSDASETGNAWAVALTNGQFWPLDKNEGDGARLWLVRSE